MNEFSAALSSGKPKMPFFSAEAIHLAFLNRLPQRYQVGRRRSSSKSKDDHPAVPHITSLQTSFNFWDGVRELQHHRFRVMDAQYAIVAGLVLFSLYIAPSAPALKVFGVVGGLWVLFMPATRQFFLPSLTIWCWLVYFFCSRFIPNEYRPHIWVRVLPALENVLYGANLSNILSAHKHPILDILAWLPYGIIHFGAPAVCALVMFVFAAPGSAPTFARAFGWMSIIGVTIQLCFPCTPPWYENENGLVPAAYGMHGSPAGLARVDAIVGIDMYTTHFTDAPLPFGAFPSLHAANAVLEALFMSHCFPQFKFHFAIYAGWVWWATMYLSHHYAIDLVGGGLLAASVFYLCRARWMPRRQADKLTRWDHEFVELGDSQHVPDVEFGNRFFSVEFERRRDSSSDGWTLGASSCSSSSGTLSPTFSEDTMPGFSVMDMENNGQLWEGKVPPRDVELKEIAIGR